MAANMKQGLERSLWQEFSVVTPRANSEIHWKRRIGRGVIGLRHGRVANFNRRSQRLAGQIVQVPRFNSERAPNES